MNNPLLEHHELPPFGSISPEHVEPAIDQILAANRKKIAELLGQATVTWENLVYAIEEIDDFLNQSFSPVSHMNSVVNSQELREAYNAVLPKLSEYQTEIGQNADLFSAYRQLLESKEGSELNQAQRNAADAAKAKQDGDTKTPDDPPEGGAADDNDSATRFSLLELE